MDSLFDDPSAFDRDTLATRLMEFAARQIYIGGSSWKYEGWLGQIYSRSNYLVRGRFSQKLFNDTCLPIYRTPVPLDCRASAYSGSYRCAATRGSKCAGTRAPTHSTAKDAATVP